MAGGVSSVYLHVVDDVISKVRDEFVNSGGGESVLSELQAIWEAKMMQCGAISPNMERPSLHRPMGQITPVHDLNVPAEEYETPTADMLFPPTPLQTPVPQTPMPQTPIQTPLIGSDQIYNIPLGSSDYAPANDSRNGGDVKAGRPNPYMQPPSPWINQRPLGVDVNVAYVEGRDEIDRALHQPTTQDFFMMSSGKRKRDEYPPHLTSGNYMPQQDGSGDMMIEFLLPTTSGNYMPQQDGSGDMMIEFLLPTESQLSSTINGGKNTIDMQSNRKMWAATVLPQQDGVHDDYDDLFHFQGVANEVYNTPTPADHVELRASTPSVSTPKLNKGEAVEDDEPPLNEDDDEDDLDDFDLGEEEPNTQHLVLAQFDKVTRTKSRWKCTLKDGIMHINTRDILFNKANGEFDF